MSYFLNAGSVPSSNHLTTVGTELFNQSPGHTILYWLILHQSLFIFYF